MRAQRGMPGRTRDAPAGREAGRARAAILVVGLLVIAGSAAAFSFLHFRPSPAPPMPIRALTDLPGPAREKLAGHRQRARVHLSNRRWEAAADELRECLEIWDGDPAVLTDLAQSILLSRMLSADPSISEDREDAMVDEALALVTRALEIDPLHVPARKRRWETLQNPLLRRYDPSAALEEAEHILSLAPHDVSFRKDLAQWLLGGIRFPRARDGKVGFDSSIGLDIAQQQAEWALEESAVGSDLYAQALQGLGMVGIFMGDFEGAVEALRGLRSYRFSPTITAGILLDEGYALLRLGRHEEAAGAFIQSIEQESTIEARWLLRLAYEGMDRNPADLPEAYRFPLREEPVDRDRPPKIRFTEVGEALGVAKVDGAGPSAFADYDGDGDPDIIAAGCDTFTALYRNEGGRFRDVTIEAGLHELEPGFSTILVDYDDDGHLDLYICRNGWNGPAPNILLRNRGDGTFEDRSRESGLDDPGSGFVSIWSDLDRDGLLDVIVGNGVRNDGSTNRLYRNRGDGTFEDVTERAGLLESRRWGTIGIAVGDYDRDGDPDIFFNGRQYAPMMARADLGSSPNRLYRNRGDGTFEEVGEQAGLSAPPHEGYVAFFVDVDNDLYPDLLATGLAPWRLVLQGQAGQLVPGGPEDVHRDATHLYRNDRDGTFTDVTFEAGLARPMGVMGANVADLDNDGWVDLYFGTGAPDPKRMEPSVFLRNDGDGTFSDLSRFAGLDHVGKGHGFTFADFDLDGDLDIYAPQGGFCHGDLWANPLYRNEAGNEHHWLHVRLVGTESNRFAVGAAVILRAGDLRQYREVQGGTGFGSTDSYTVEFGLGDRTEIEEVEVLWPSGQRQRLVAPPVDRRIEVVEGKEGWRVLPGQGP